MILSGSNSKCSICSQLAEREYATQKFGWEEDDTHMPAASGQLETVKDLKPDSSRNMILKRCPECGKYYLYESDYEYLAGGSEDSQQLTRLSEDEARGYLE